MTPPRSILLVRLSAIGDVVHGLPLLCRLRRGFPGARIAWAVGERAAPLLEGHPALDERIVLEKRRPLELVRRALALRGERFDVAVDLQGLLVSGAVAALSGAARRVGFDTRRVRERFTALLHSERLAPAPGDGPVIEQNLAFADRLGAPPAPLEFRLEPTAAERERASALVPPGAAAYAAIIVGAGKAANRPFVHTLAGAARRLGGEGFRIAVLGGGANAAEGDAVLREAGLPGAAGVNLCGRTSLRETLALLADAAVAIGGDTGPLHMAAATGTPVVALFGGANPGRTGPRGSPAHVVWKRWRCAPCYRWHCPIGRECLDAIPGEEVAAGAMAVIREDGYPVRSSGGR